MKLKNKLRTGFMVLIPLLAGLSFSVLPSGEDQTISIGISDFAMQGGSADQAWIGNSCIDAISVKLASDKQFKVIERKYLGKVIEELKLQASGLIDENTAVELGDLIAVKYFIFGSASVAGENLVLRARVVDVATSAVVFAEEVSGTLNDLFKLQSGLSLKITSTLKYGKAGSAGMDESASISYSAGQKLERIKKMGQQMPFFLLDPARKRKTSEYTLAIGMCEDLIEKYPGLGKAHLYRGLFSLQNGDLESADVSTKEARRLDPDDVEAYLARAFSFLFSGRTEDCGNILSFAAERFPSDARIYYAMSRASLEQRRDSKAIEALVQCVNTNPVIPQAETNLRSLVTTVPFSAGQFSDQVHYKVAALYKALYGTGESIDRRDYQLAKEVEAESTAWALPYYIMGLYEKVNGSKTDAALNFRKAISINPTFTDAHRELGILMLATGKCEKGRRHVQLYMKNTNVVTDAADIQRRIRECGR